MSFEASCPTCGGPVQFNVDTSLVTVCESCGTVAGRGDGKLESYGKVADLVQTDSPLQVGLSGEVKGVPFVVTGRAQLKHAAGGVWDEWYVAFKDGQRWGWLAEAQGRYYLTFRKQLPSKVRLDFEELQIESQIMIPQVGNMKVVELGTATAVSAEGEIPYEFHPGAAVQYADLQGPGGKFATIDNSEDPPAFYLGGEFSLTKLGISEQAASREQEERVVASVGVSCPNCGGALELRAPDQTMRIACQYCDSLIDVADGGGSLKFLEALGKQKVKPVIPLGSEGELRGRKYTVIGFMRRKVRSGGVDYPWQEYLLYTPRQPFHWLIHSNSHWSLGKPVSAGAVQCDFRTARHEGRRYRLFDRSSPVVTNVLGEFYWQVTKGERTFSSDYVSPPYMLSREESQVGGSDSQQAAAQAVAAAAQPSAREVNYTCNEYIPREEIEEAFKVKGLRKPINVAPNQPYPHKGIYPLAGIFVAAAMVLCMLFFMTGSRKKVYEKQFALQRTPEQPVFFSDQPLEIEGRRNLRVTLYSPVQNSWVYLAGDIFNEDTGETQPFDAEVQYYRGRTGGENWQEGSHTKRRYVSALPAGQYSLRFAFQWDRAKPSATAKVTIHQGVPRLFHFIMALLVLLALPIGVAIHHGSFEARRWSESDFASSD